MSDNLQIATIDMTEAPKPMMLSVGTYDEALRLGKLCVAAGLCPDERDEAKAAIKILAGIEMGLGPVASVQGLWIHQKTGKVGQHAELIKDQIAKHPRYSYETLEVNDDCASVQFFKDGKPLSDKNKGVITWTWERAVAAGFTSGPNGQTWQKHKRNMLFKQCIVDGARFYCPGLFGGIPIITEDELIPAQNDIQISFVKRLDIKEESPEEKPTAPPEPKPQGEALLRNGEFIDGKYRTELYKVGSPRWKLKDVNAYCITKWGTPTDTPVKLTWEQYDETVEYLKHNDPPTGG